MNNTMIDTDFLKELDRFSFMIKKRVSSVYAGERRSIKHGKGIDIIDLREYYPGDDIKLIDWNAYARTERLYIRRYEEEKNLTTHIIVDSSNSMDFGFNITKFEYAKKLAIGFAYLVTKENEKFALSTYSDRINEVIQPKRGKKHFLKTVEYLSLKKSEGKTNIEVSMDEYIKFIRSKSLIILISDFIEPVEEIERALYKVSRFVYDFIVINLLDPVERYLELKGDYKLYDMETERILKSYIGERFRKEYIKRVEDHLLKVNKICREINANFYSYTTDTPIFDVFLEILAC